jgi:transcriptional regulator with XRE-family HTH domain
MGLRPAPLSAFAVLLRQYRQRQGLSMTQLARAASVDASYISLLETDKRVPPRRAVVGLLARALWLSPGETDILLFAAGHPPDAAAARAVLAVLADPHLSAAARARFGRAVVALAAAWQDGAAAGEGVA